MVKKSIGIEAKKPEKSCSDKNCPWHGTLSLRKKTFVGEIVRDKGSKTAIVKWGYNYFITKYDRSERRHSSAAAHNPECINAKKGSIVKIVECRPISKTKKFAVVEIIGEKK